MTLFFFVFFFLDALFLDSLSFILSHAIYIAWYTHTFPFLFAFLLFFVLVYLFIFFYFHCSLLTPFVSDLAFFVCDSMPISLSLSLQPWCEYFYLPSTCVSVGCMVLYLCVQCIHLYLFWFFFIFDFSLFVYLFVDSSLFYTWSCSNLLFMSLKSCFARVAYLKLFFFCCSTCAVVAF